MIDLKWAWKLFKRVGLFTGVLLSGFAIIEILNAYTILRDIEPWLGILFLLVIAALLIWGVSVFLVSLYKRPRVLIPPESTDTDIGTDASLRKRREYLRKYLLRLSTNPSLDDTERRSAVEAAETLIKRYSNTSDPAARLQVILDCEAEAITPLLKSLDIQADQWIRRCVGEIMIGVTLSPFRAADLLFVLYRNGVMVIKLVGIYNSRPLLREQLQILRDTMRTVAAVNYLNFSEKFIEQLLQSAPFIGRVADDITQGVGAGLLTSAAGHAAKYRCRSFRKWDQTEARTHMMEMIAVYFKDIRDIFWKDVLPLFERRIPVKYLKEFRSALTTVFESTGRFMEKMVLQPAQRIRKSGTSLTEYSKQGGRRLFRVFNRRNRRTEEPE
ncbi:YcjF family protein [Candidatus Zixiibacteriota bacterium]